MKHFLMKTDPDTYSIDQLEKDGTTIWDGVHNFQAINIIKNMEVGDMIYVYHSQTDKAILGMMKVIGEPYKNEKDVRTSWVVEVKFLKRYSKIVTLADLKANGEFNDFLLIRNGRLSVMEVPEKIVNWLEERLK